MVWWNMTQMVLGEKMLELALCMKLHVDAGG
jgi:hypothetical protein